MISFSMKSVSFWSEFIMIEFIINILNIKNIK